MYLLNTFKFIINVFINIIIHTYILILIILLLIFRVFILILYCLLCSLNYYLHSFYLSLINFVIIFSFNYTSLLDIPFFSNLYFVFICIYHYHLLLSQYCIFYLEILFSYLTSLIILSILLILIF